MYIFHVQHKCMYTYVHTFQITPEKFNDYFFWETPINFYAFSIEAKSD